MPIRGSRTRTTLRTRRTKPQIMVAPPTPQKRPGGRSQRIWEAVSAAVVELLVEAGYDGVAMTEVARRAGVNPTSLYRRWGTREALLTAVLATQAQASLVVPDTGSLRGDLISYLSQAAAFLQSPYGAALLQLGAAALGRPDLQRYRLAYAADRLPPVATLLDRAVARGEVTGGRDPAEAIELLAGPLYARLLFTARPIDAGLIEASVDRVLNTWVTPTASAGKARVRRRS